MKGIVAYEARDYCSEFNHNWRAFKVSNRYFEKAGHVCLLKLASANAVTTLIEPSAIYSASTRAASPTRFRNRAFLSRCPRVSL
tara:strand:- start:31 stop:282 length:252 start_codon:yes stop_codon:yes gene_type:complete